LLIAGCGLLIGLTACKSGLNARQGAANEKMNTISTAVMFKDFYYAPYKVHCYLIAQNGEGVIVDAGGCDEEITALVRQNNLNIKYIILTHGHRDHVEQAQKLKARLGAEIVLNKADQELYKETSAQVPDILLSGAQDHELGGMKIMILPVPGHTLGSQIVMIGDLIFLGDTPVNDLLAGSKESVKSYLDKLLPLPEQITAYPGHGDKLELKI
jgi:glyoxylase-like metal-dependent hydrolase (beta-lactamase superfamily II)